MEHDQNCSLRVDFVFHRWFSNIESKRFNRPILSTKFYPEQNTNPEQNNLFRSLLNNRNRNII